MAHDKLWRIRMIASQEADSLKKLPIVLNNIFLLDNVASFPLRLAESASIHSVCSYSVIFRKFLEKVGVILAMIAISGQIKDQGSRASLGLLAIGGHFETLIVDAFD